MAFRGRSESEMQVVADGDFTRYQGRMYDGALNRADILSIWVVPQEILIFKPLVPVFQGQGDFLLPHKRVFASSHNKKRRKTE